MKLQESGFQLPSFLPRLSYEKQDTLLKLLILSICAVLCKYNNPHDLSSNVVHLLFNYFHDSIYRICGVENYFLKRCWYAPQGYVGKTKATIVCIHILIFNLKSPTADYNWKPFTFYLLYSTV